MTGGLDAAAERAEDRSDVLTATLDRFPDVAEPVANRERLGNQGAARWPGLLGADERSRTEGP